MTVIKANIPAIGDKGLELCPHFPVHFSFSCLSSSLSWLFFSPVGCGGLLNLPSSSYHLLWVCRIFHTAFGLRSVKHLRQGTKYRNQYRETVTASCSNPLPSNFDGEGSSVGYSLCNSLRGCKLTLSSAESTCFPLHDSLLTVRKKAYGLHFAWICCFWPWPQNVCAVWVK